MNAPIFSRLMSYYSENRISFAMPGHKNGAGLDKRLLDCDVTELDATVDLHHGCKEVTEANKLLSALYGSDESRIITEGSSAAIHAMLASVLNQGDTLLADVSCHRSVVNTCALCGFNIRLFTKSDSIGTTISTHKDIKAVIVTSPDYYGVCHDIKTLADICHSHKIPLIVDEAHGAHFPASKKLPDSAVVLGADLICQSAHKTLNALTGAAYLHVCGSLIDRSRLWNALEMFASTSPSYVIAASADLARAGLENTDKWDKLYDICQNFKNRITADTDISIMKNDDFSRIVLDFSSYAVTGFEIDRILSAKYGIDVEMSDDRRIVMITTPCNTEYEFDKMHTAICEIASGIKKGADVQKAVIPPVSKTLIMPHRAFYSKRENVPFAKSSGRIACTSVTSYPPGIPVILPGAVITDEQVEYILSLEKSGATITGLDNEFIQCVTSEETEVSYPWKQ